MSDHSKCSKGRNGQDDGVALLTAVAVVFMFAALVVIG
jgi:hypothetical protein